MNRLQVARVPVDARLLREETSRDSILDRKVEVRGNLKSHRLKGNGLTVEEGCCVERNTSSDLSKISRIGVSRAAFKPPRNADESVSAVTCLVAVTGHCH